MLVLEEPVDASELCDAVASDFPVWVAVDPVAVVEGPAVMVTGIIPSTISSLTRVVYAAGWEKRPLVGNTSVHLAVVVPPIEQMIVPSLKLTQC